MTTSGHLWQRTGRLVALALVFLMLGATAADAKRRAKKKRASGPPVNEAALAALRGPFKFGMTRKDVLKILSSQIHEKYAEKISSTTDVYVQDKLRRKRDAEISKFKKSFVAFKGSSTGWEGSIIHDQFSHKTDESMMMFWETDPESGLDQRRFFFFHDGKLYKMFVALNSDALKEQQRNFAFLKSMMEARFGGGEVTQKVDREGNKVPWAVHWKTKKYDAWALDNMQVFGAFCLVIADAPTVAQVEQARAALPKEDKRVHLIDGVIERDSESGPSLDEGNKDVIDGLVK